MGIELTNEQVYAVYKMENWWNHRDKQIFEISGSAGTGKSFIVRYLIEKLGLKYSNVLFCSFSGKAATLLSKNGLPAKTIHSAIYDYKEKVVRDEYGKLVLDERGYIKLKKEFELKPQLSKKIKLIVVDEASMVNDKIGEDLASFGIPIIALGDLNQLPPVFGESYFLKNPDVILHKVMRQAGDSPIVYLAQQILHGERLKYGVYGTSYVINRNDLDDYKLKSADMIITGTNRTRYNINKYYRERFKNFKNLDFPHINEKVICRKNNWDMCLDGKIYLTNGISGFVEKVYRESFNGRTLKIDFRPDFSKSTFRNIYIDYKHLYAMPGAQEDNNSWYYDKFEYAYAISVHVSQGSEFKKVLYIHENFMNNKEDEIKMMYTGITRASESIGIVL